MVLTLYKTDASPPVRAVLMTIELLKIPNVEYAEVRALEREHMKEEYLKMNPQHTIPTLKDDDYVVWDSHAIIVYLASVYGKDDSLYPTDPKKQATINQRLHFDSGVLFPALKNTISPIVHLGEKAYREESLNKIKSAYDLTDKVLTKDWIAGDQLTLADISCISTISSMNEILPIDKDRYVNLWKWFQRCSEQPFYKSQNEPGLLQLRELLKSKFEENANK